MAQEGADLETLHPVLGRVKSGPGVDPRTEMVARIRPAVEGRFGEPSQEW